MPHDTWLTGPDRPSLARDVIHVWRAMLDCGAEQLAMLSACLADDEGERARRFAFETDRLRFIAARGLLRVVLSRYVSLAPAEIQFRQGHAGKPAFLRPAGTPVTFNLSHSGGLALIAVGCEREVGVDVERIDETLAFEELEDDVLSPAEREALHAEPPVSRRAAFFARWARKEALVKACGTGLSAPLSTLDLTGDPGPRSLPAGFCADAGRSWLVRALRPAEGYAGAVAAEGGDWQASCWSVPDDAPSHPRTHVGPGTPRSARSLEP
jgi:4'-phosphopantetheinyl transferase